jgi:hypothetical protein
MPFLKRYRFELSPHARQPDKAAMNEEKYRQVCEACDRVLRAPGASLERVAIPWLHVLNEHPANLSQYTSLFGQHDFGLRRLSSEVKGILSVILAFLKKSSSQQQPLLPPNADVIIFSHLLNTSQLGAAEDFYFGQLPEALIAQGVNTVVALHDHTGMMCKNEQSSWPAAMALRVLLPRRLSGFDELRLWRRLLKESGHLKDSSSQAANVFCARVYKTAAEHAIGPPAMAILRLHTQVQEMVKNLRPTSIVVTYEGHAWERIVFEAARSVNPSIRCVAYQHTILFPRQHAISRGLGPSYDPDIVCTAGHITKQILQRISGLLGMPLVTVGTHRQKNLKLSFPRKVEAPIVPACLVIPDGTMEECVLILDFVLKSALMVPAVIFIIRMHPVMPFSAVMKRDVRLRSLPANVKISHESFDIDLGRCRWALYRGSSAAILAAAVGLRPLYYRPRGEMLGIDPLYEMQTWRRVVETGSDLKASLDFDMQCDIDVLEREWLPAHDFCGQYYTAADLETFCRAVMNC